MDFVVDVLIDAIDALCLVVVMINGKWSKLRDRATLNVC